MWIGVVLLFTNSTQQQLELFPECVNKRNNTQCWTYHKQSNNKQWIMILNMEIVLSQNSYQIKQNQFRSSANHNRFSCYVGKWRIHFQININVLKRHNRSKRNYKYMLDKSWTNEYSSWHSECVFVLTKRTNQ